MDELTSKEQSSAEANLKPDELVKLWDEFRHLTLLIIVFMICIGVVITLNP